MSEQSCPEFCLCLEVRHMQQSPAVKLVLVSQWTELPGTCPVVTERHTWVVAWREMVSSQSYQIMKHLTTRHNVCICVSPG